MRRPAGGFSLVEVLLATGLLAAGMALAFLSLRNAAVATERAQAEAADSERLRAVQGFLRRQLAIALPQPIEIDPGSGEAVVFELERRQLRFLASMPGYLSRGGAQVQTLRLVPDGEGWRLEFEHRLLTAEGPAEPERPPEVLLRGIAEGGFEARGLTPEGEPGPWRDRWETPGQLPLLVRLRLQARDAGKPFPDLLVALRLGAAFAPVQMIDTPGSRGPREDSEDGRPTR